MNLEKNLDLNLVPDLFGKNLNQFVDLQESRLKVFNKIRYDTHENQERNFFISAQLVISISFIWAFIAYFFPIIEISAPLKNLYFYDDIFFGTPLATALLTFYLLPMLFPIFHSLFFLFIIFLDFLVLLFKKDIDLEKRNYPHILIGILIRIFVIVPIVYGIVEIVVLYSLSYSLGFLISETDKNQIPGLRYFTFAKGFYLLLISYFTITIGSLIYCIWPKPKRFSWTLASLEHSIFRFRFNFLLIFFHVFVIVFSIVLASTFGFLNIRYQPCTNRNNIASRLTLPSKFHIENFNRVKQISQITSNEYNIVFAGTMGDSVYSVKDNVSIPFAIISKLKKPSAVHYDFESKSLFVATLTTIIRFENMNQTQFTVQQSPTTIYDKLLPNGYTGHRYLKIGPDRKLYVSQESTCNACLPSSPLEATILRMDLNGSNIEVFAKGIRQSIGFDFHPKTKNLWFSSPGRLFYDYSGPLDELNEVSSIGQDFGFPYCIIPPNSTIKTFDVEFVQSNVTCNSNQIQQPKLMMSHHSSPGGMTFYSGSMFPSSYNNSIFIAERGIEGYSTGFQITRITPNLIREQFVYGWFNNQTKYSHCGQPIDVHQMKDGSLLISDEDDSSIYRVTYLP
jgi:hypothetical protein